MSGSQEPRAALVSVQDQGTINRILETTLEDTTEEEGLELLMVTQQVLTRVAQYSQPVREIQQVCNHPAEIADLRNQITILQAQTRPPPLVCDHTVYEIQLTTLRERIGGSRTNSLSSRNGRRRKEGVGRYDQGRPRSQRGESEFENAVSKCAILSRTGSATSPPPTRGQRTEVPRLPGLFRIGSHSVARLDCATSDGHPPYTQQVPRRTSQDEVRLQPPERARLEANLAARPGQWRNRAGRPASLYTTPGSSFWGPRPSSHRGTRDEGN